MKVLESKISVYRRTAFVFLALLIIAFVYLCSTISSEMEKLKEAEMLDHLRHSFKPIDGSYELYEDDGEVIYGEEEEEIEPELPLRVYTPGEPKYMTVIHGFGPNNQYLGLKDAMYMAKLTGRILGRPDFFTHAIDHLNSIRSFERTFNIDEISKYLPTVSLKEFAKLCDNRLDRIVWARSDRSWRHVVDIWLLHTGLTVLAESHVEGHLLLRSENAVADHFAPFQNERCIAFAFPFRNVAETNERKDLAKYLVRAPWILDARRAAYREMEITSASNLMAIHWRWGEDSCGWWYSPAPHEDYDFCYGTAIFHFARMKDVADSLMREIHERQVKAVYLSFSALYFSRENLEVLKTTFEQNNIRFYMGRQSLSSIENITDNYFLSLIEQDICANAETFIWSSDSTWSDFIVDQNERTHGPLTTISFSRLLMKYGYPYSTWNRERDVGILDLKKRPRPYYS